MSRKIVLAGACRTTIGKMGGGLNTTPAVELGALAIKEALQRVGVKPEQVDHVYMGNILQTALGQNPARQAALKVGLPYTSVAVTVSIVCGSGLNCVDMTAQMIEAGDADIVVVGGMENTSIAPYALAKAHFGYHMNNATMIGTMVNDGLWDAFNDYHMGIATENVAEKYGLMREELDAFSANSQQKAVAMQQSGAFDEEIVPVEIKTKKGTTVFNKGEGPRGGTTVETLSKLKPAFEKDGIVTVGNSSGTNDGTAAVVMMSEEKAKEFGVKPMAVWIGGALGGVDPAIMGVGPVEAPTRLFKKTGFGMQDMDLIEANEAFAAQSVAVARDLDLDMAEVNVNGGAVALGHPIGASGCHIFVTLLYVMRHKSAKRGLAMLCIGGGQGCATIVEQYNQE